MLFGKACQTSHSSTVVEAFLFNIAAQVKINLFKAPVTARTRATIITYVANKVLLRKYLCGDENEKAARARHTRESGGIQANSAQQTWIPACAGMTSRGENRVKEIPPFSSSVGERKLMEHFVTSDGSPQVEFATHPQSVF